MLVLRFWIIGVKGGTMTWEELKEKAKEMGYELDKYYTEYFSKDIEEGFEIRFDECGDVIISYDKGICIANVTMAEHRTPEQMLMIMRGLE